MKYQRGNFGARIIQWGNDENTVNQARVLKGYRIKDLAAMIGVCVGTLSKLINGMASPKYEYGRRAGEIKPWVLKLSKILNSDIEDLFPREFCKIEIPSEKNLAGDPVAKNFIGSYSLHHSQGVFPESEIFKKEIKFFINKILLTVNEREEAVLRGRFFENKTLEDLSKVYGVQKERIRQIEARALRKLRHPTRLDYLMSNLGQGNWPQ